MNLVNKRIAVVDDSAVDRVLVADVAEKLGFDNVDFFDNAESFLTELQRSGEPEHAVLLLDLNLGDECGLQTLQAVRRSRFKELPVVVHSDQDDPFTVQRCYELGASAFVRKADCPDRYREIVEVVFNFWANISLTPWRLS